MKLKYIVYMVFILVSCRPKEKLSISGYAYENEVISIYNENSIEVFNLKVNSEVTDISGLCVLFEQTNIYKKNKDFKIRVVLDSNNLKLIDTVVIIKKENKEPFILFADPKDTRFKRKIFIDDDSRYIKY
ncbi:MAG: hypothetical protein WCY25_08525 [Moheibacter sp.]